jgi:hypothetical protein
MTETVIIVILLILCVIFAGLCLTIWLGRDLRGIGIANEFRIALHYIADRPDLTAAHFANLFLTGRTTRLNFAYPDFRRYREEMLADEDEVDNVGA